jgi:hypothetical protein
MNSFRSLVYREGSPNATGSGPAAQRLSSVLGMFSSLEVKVLRPT